MVMVQNRDLSALGYETNKINTSNRTVSSAINDKFGN